MSAGVCLRLFVVEKSQARSLLTKFKGEQLHPFYGLDAVEFARLGTRRAL